MNNQLPYLRQMIDYLLEEYDSQESLDQRSSRFKGLRYEHTDQLTLPQKPWSDDELFSIWRGLINRREPHPIQQTYLDLEDAFLKEVQKEPLLVSLQSLDQEKAPFYLWQGDITRLTVDAIVNAANSDMLGCFIPNHQCVDNQIHAYAGVRLRLELNDQMIQQGRKEPVGKARVTSGYHLPAKYIIHTVGPVITGDVNAIKQQQLKKCYLSCLTKADELGLESIAFPCISTGQFGYPQREAAKIAYQTVCDYLTKHSSKLQVVFCVYSVEDYELYHALLEGEVL